MSYLLDTHTMLWALMDTGKLSGKVKQVLEDNRLSVFVSSISFWEISLKSSLGKLDLDGISPEQLPEYCTRVGFELLPLSPALCASYHLLTAQHHRDSFDRMLIWQAIQSGCILISKDHNFQAYGDSGLKVLW